MKTLITGISGFFGFHLAKELLSEGDIVIGFSRTNPESFKQLSSKVQFIKADLLEKAKIQRILTETRPERIFHLAAQSLIPRSFENPQETIKTNVIGTLNLLEAIRTLELKTIFVSVGSSAEYGLTTREKELVKEDDPLLPQSPYGISKVAQGLFIQMYSRAYSFNGIHLRPFAVIGPLKRADAVSDFAKSIVAIEQKKQEVIGVGNLEARRDFIDIRDAVRAMILLSQEGKAGETYNICLGKGTSLTEVLGRLIKLAKTVIKVKKDPAKARPLDDPVIIGDASKLQNFGFKPKYSLNQTLKDTLEYWRKQI